MTSGKMGYVNRLKNGIMDDFIYRIVNGTISKKDKEIFDMIIGSVKADERERIKKELKGKLNYNFDWVREDIDVVELFKIIDEVCK